MQIPPRPTDFAVTAVIPNKNIVGRGYTLSIYVTVENQGDITETFEVYVYANTTIIQTKTITLTSTSSTSLTFTWNTTGFVKGNYTIKAEVSFYGDIDIADNTFTDDVVTVTIPGDSDGDYDVDSADLFRLAPAYLSIIGGPCYNPNCDFDNDGDIDSSDLFILAPNFLQEDP